MLLTASESIMDDKIKSPPSLQPSLYSTLQPSHKATVVEESFGAEIYVDKKSPPSLNFRTILPGSESILDYK